MVHREVMTFLAEAQASPHRPLDPGALDDLDKLEHCFWIPAGGYQAESERESTAASVSMIGAPDR